MIYLAQLIPMFQGCDLCLSSTHVTLGMFTLDHCVCAISADDKFHLLDGDKIAILIASYVKQLLSVSGLSDSIALGLVQTAYANGASTDYISQKLVSIVVLSRQSATFLPVTMAFLY